MKVHGANNTMRAEYISQPSSFDIQIVTEKLRSTNLLILFGIRKNCHSSGSILLLYLFIRRVTELNIAITKKYLLSTTSERF
jgi:hypothetical protein